jgi:hypothetical protein
VEVRGQMVVRVNPDDDVSDLNQFAHVPLTSMG